MMKKAFLTLFLALTVLFGMSALHHPVLALNCDNPQSAKEQIQCGACDASGTTDAKGNPTCDPGKSAGGVGSTITTVINLLSAVGGVAAVIVIVVAGLRYVTSGGKEEGVKNAKNGILYAIIGLVVIALAQLIVHFVLNQTTNATDCVNGKTSTGQKC